MYEIKHRELSSAITSSASSSSSPLKTQKIVLNSSKIANSFTLTSSLSDIQLNGDRRKQKLIAQRITKSSASTVKIATTTATTTRGASSSSTTTTTTKTPEIKSKVLSTHALRISNLFLTNVYRIMLLILIGCPGFNNGE